MGGMKVGAIGVKRIMLGFLLVAGWQAIAQEPKHLIRTWRRLNNT